MPSKKGAPRSPAQIAALERMRQARNDAVEARRLAREQAPAREAEMPEGEPGVGDMPQAIPRGYKPGAAAAAPTVSASKVSDDELTGLFVGACNAFAELPGQSHWRIEPSEAKAVTVPLTRWMAGKSKAAKFAAENANTLLLIGGLAGVLGPRVVLTARKGFRDDGRDDRRAGEPARAHTRNPLAERDTGEPVDFAARRRSGAADQARPQRPGGDGAEAVNGAVASSLGGASRTQLF